MKLIVNIFSFLLITQLAFGQVKTEKSVLEYNVVELESEYFPNQKRIIKIFLPNNYDSLKKYPVIYVLDGSSLFDMTSNYVAQLSKVTIEDDYDYATDAIPQSIVVGIFHGDRGYETQPNFGNNSNADETIFLEGAEKLKDFLFKEVVSFIGSTYNTSGYNAIIGHSNTAHFAMCLLFQKGNPFKGIISISLSGDSESFKNKVKSYLDNNEDINVFIAYGTKDFDFNEFAQSIKDKVSSENLKVSEFNANHNEMPSLSLVTGLKYLFRDYRNIEDFNEKSSEKDFDIKQYLQQYQTKNKEAYGIDTKVKEDDFYSMLQLSINSKNIEAFNQILEYDSKVNGYPTQTHMLFVYNEQIGDYEKAEQIANQMLNSKDGFENRILKANLQLYYEFFTNDLKDLNKTITFFEEGKKRFEGSQLEFSYFIAKASIENNFRREMGTSNLKYCIENYRENRYFTEIDLENLKDQ